MKVEDVTPLAKKSTWMWCSWQKMNKHFVTFVPSACTQLSVNARFSFPSRSHGTDTCESCSFITWRSCSHAVMHLESVYHQLLQFFKDKQSILISSTQLFFFFFFWISCLERAPSASHLFQDMQLASVSLLFHLQFHSCMCPTRCCFVQWQHLD